MLIKNDYGFQLRIQSQKRMIIILKTYSRKFTMQNIKKALRGWNWYFYTLIDDAVARVVRSEGGLYGLVRTMTAT